MVGVLDAMSIRRLRAGKRGLTWPNVHIVAIKQQPKTRLDCQHVRIMLAKRMLTIVSELGAILTRTHSFTAMNTLICGNQAASGARRAVGIIMDVV